MSIPEGKFELDLMRGYEESFRNRMSRVVSLSYDCMPLNPQEYSQKVIEVFESMKAIDPTQKDLNLYDDIILGKIEGQSAATNFKQIVQSIVGEVSEDKLKAYLKQKSQQRSFGASNKDKNSCIRQVKKLQSLQTYFDVPQITKQRKQNKLFSTAIKSLAKYLELYAKIVQTDPTTIEKAFDQYNTYIKEQKKSSQFLKEQQQTKNIALKPIIEQMKPQREYESLQAIQEQNKIAEIQPVKQRVQDQKKPSKQAEQKTPIKTKTKKKELKVEEPAMPEINSGEATEKEKCESEEKEKKNVQQKQKEKETKKQQKTVKKTNKLLTEFLGFKREKNIEAVKKPFFEEQKGSSLEKQEQPNLEVCTEQQILKAQSVWDTFGEKAEKQGQTNVEQIWCLRKQFRSYQMQNEQYNPEPHFTNIIITLSTIEYYDYPMQIDRDVLFGDPFKKIKNVMYFEDESEEFEGQSADQGAEEEDQEEEDELSEGNHTILSDDHLSNEELSSCEVNDLHLKIEYGKGRKWVINFVSRTTSIYSDDELEICNSFSMISLETDQKMPLRLDEEEQTEQFVMTAELWRDAYKSAHGHYGTKDSIVKDLSALMPEMSKNSIDSMLKERSQKIGNQRFIKKDFIDDLKQKFPQIDSLLEKVLDDRNQELRKIKAEKNQQKDLKLERDILECTGSRYIVNLIKQLKDKGYKQMRRNQLIEFINERKGEEWEKIKIQMNTMSRPIDELIRNMPISERIHEEVEVDDEEFRKIHVQGKQDGDSNNSTKDKNDPSDSLIEKEKGSKVKNRKIEEKKGQKSIKIKKRRNKHNPVNIYQKAKPTNRGRKTKNSLKTGIPSIEELKKKKEEVKKNNEDESENQDQNELSSSSKPQNEQNQDQNQIAEGHEIMEKDENLNENQVELKGQNEDLIGLEYGDQQKKSIEKSVVLSEMNEERIWSVKETPIKEDGTAQKSERKDDNVMTLSNIENA